MEEHQRIIAREHNPELSAFYQLCWHLGGSQSDVANLHAEDIDWQNWTIFYRRRKTQTPAIIRFGDSVKELLKQLPSSGPLFPLLAPMHEKHRAKLFNRRCRLLGISGVTPFLPLRLGRTGQNLRLPWPRKKVYDIHLADVGRV